MDERDDLYEKIVEEFKRTGSVKKVVENLNSNTIKVRRVLITEGLWESKSSRSVGELFAQGKSVKEIAEILCMSEKNVQSYIPYTRGAYGGTKSNDAERSGNYRNRKKQAADNLVSMHVDAEENDMTDMEMTKKDNIILFPSDEVAANIENLDFEDDVEPRLPGVLKLRFELVAPYESERGKLDMEPDEEREFLKLAKAEKGIIREVLVPGETTLHALHYMIQRLFGWQNSHLHHYSVSDEDFDTITYDQKLAEYLKLCGILFRFPGAELDDRFWDEDYEAEYSIKSWLKSKYTCGYFDLSVEDTYLRSREYVKDLKKRYKKAFKDPNTTLEDFKDTVVFENPYNLLVESLPIRHIFKNSCGDGYKVTCESWRELMQIIIAEREEILKDRIKDEPEAFKALDDAMQDLLNTRKNILNIKRYMGRGQGKAVKDFYGMEPEEILEEEKSVVKELEEMLCAIMADSSPKTLPFAEELFYSYDYGDDWRVRITCVDAYMANDNYDVSHGLSMIQREDGKKRYHKVLADDLQYTDRTGKSVDDMALREKLQEVYLKGWPICVMADGLGVMDDVGGLYGYQEFLKTINDKSPEAVMERQDNLSWAKSQGWTGRKIRPENML